MAASLQADAIIACTGYQSMHETVAQIVSREVADKVGPCWGLGSGVRGDPGPWQGELRNMWKPTAQESAVVPRRQSGAVALLFEICGAADQGADGRDRDAGLQDAAVIAPSDSIRIAFAPQNVGDEIGCATKFYALSNCRPRSIKSPSMPSSISIPSPTARRSQRPHDQAEHLKICRDRMTKPFHMSRARTGSCDASALAVNVPAVPTELKEASPE